MLLILNKNNYYKGLDRVKTSEFDADRSMSWPFVPQLASKGVTLQVPH